MAKPLEYPIKLTNHPDNAGSLKSLSDSISKAMRGADLSIQSVGESAVAQLSAIERSVVSASQSLGGLSRNSGSLRESSVGPVAPAAPIGSVDPVGPSGVDAAAGFNRDFEREQNLNPPRFMVEMPDVAGVSSDFMSDLGTAFDSNPIDVNPSVGFDPAEISAEADELKRLLDSKLAADAVAVGVSLDDDVLSDQLGDSLRQLEDLERAGGGVGKELSSSFREIASKAEESASGIGQLASGLAFLTAGNEDAKEFINTLLKIKGATDVGLGLFKSLSGLVQVTSLVKDRTALRSQAQQIDNQRTQVARQAALQYVTMLDRQGISLLKATNGNRAHAAALRQVATEARRAAIAERDFNTSASSGGFKGGGGRGSGIAGLIGSSLGGSVGGGGLVSTVASQAGGSIGASIGGASIGAAAIPAAAIAGVGLTAGALTVGLIGLADTLDGSASDIDSNTAKIGSSAAEWADYVGDMTGLFDLIDSSGLEAAESMRAFAKQNQAQIDAINKQFDDKQEAADLSLSREADDAALGSSFERLDLEVQSGLMSDLAAETQKAAALAGRLTVQADIYQKSITGTGVSLVESNAALDDGIDLAGRLVAVQKDQLKAIQQETDERRKANEEVTKGLRDRLSLLDEEERKQRDIYSTEKERLENAAIRFVKLSEVDKLEALSAKRLADAGRASELSRSQRDLLDSIGTRDASTAVRGANLADAQNSGFFRSFGGDEQQRIADAQRARQQAMSESQQVQVQIANQVAVDLKIQSNEQAITDKVTRQVLAAIAERDRLADLRRRTDAREFRLNNDREMEASQSQFNQSNPALN